MPCHDAQFLLQERLDGRLDQVVGAELDRHLAACPACREDARRLSDAWSLLGRDSEAASGRTWWDGLRSRIRRQKRSRLLGLAVPLAAAAAIMLALLAAVRTVGPRVPDPVEAQVRSLPPEDRELLIGLSRSGMWDLVENIEIVKALELLDRETEGFPTLEREGEAH